MVVLLTCSAESLAIKLCGCVQPRLLEVSISRPVVCKCCLARLRRRWENLAVRFPSVHGCYPCTHQGWAFSRLLGARHGRNSSHHVADVFVRACVPCLMHTGWQKQQANAERVGRRRRRELSSAFSQHSANRQPVLSSIMAHANWIDVNKLEVRVYLCKRHRTRGTTSTSSVSVNTHP